jgi:hypothetical protein
MKMNGENDKEVTKFILQAIEKLSLAILTGNYDNRELDELHQMAGIHLFDLK